MASKSTAMTPPPLLAVDGPTVVVQQSPTHMPQAPQVVYVPIQQPPPAQSSPIRQVFDEAVQTTPISEPNTKVKEIFEEDTIKHERTMTFDMGKFHSVSIFIHTIVLIAVGTDMVCPC